jgi:hypothetical protein
MKPKRRRFQKSAEQGYELGQNKLGWLYDLGRGVPKDLTAAFAWFRKAAEQGLPEAQTNLGLAYFNGRGVAQDRAEAVVWFRKAAEQGYAPAQATLGGIYMAGSGATKDYAEAAVWLRKAAEQGEPKAQHDLAMIYERGLGVPSDPVAANWVRDPQGRALSFIELPGFRLLGSNGVECTALQVWVCDPQRRAHGPLRLVKRKGSQVIVGRILIVWIAALSKVQDGGICICEDTAYLIAVRSRINQPGESGAH